MASRLGDANRSSGQEIFAYDKCIDSIREASKRKRWIWFLIGLVLFALILLRGNSAAKVGIAVLLFHGLGHFVRMRLCGYKDFSMVLYPFHGCCGSGQNERAPVWQQRRPWPAIPRTC